MTHQDDNLISSAITQLATIFDPSTQPISSSQELKEALWAACEHIAQALNIPLIKPTTWQHIDLIHDLIMAITRESLIRVRIVTLANRWWEMDNGPLLVFDQNSKQPYALIRKNAYYQLIDPVTGQSSRLTVAKAQLLSPMGYFFYPSFPNAKLDLFSIIRFAFQHQKQDVQRIIFLQLGLSVFALLVPIATGTLLNKIIPDAQIGLMWQWLFALGVCAVAGTFFTAAQVLCFIRLRYKMNAFTQAAVWDRLLRVPVNFFHQFSPGDLAQRASGIDTIQQQLTMASLQSVLSGIFSLLLLGLMFYYSALLATVASILLLSIVAMLLLNAYLQLKYQRPIAYLRGKLAALTLQFLTGIGKLRASHSESRAFVLWTEPFVHKTRSLFKSGLLQMHFSILTGLMTLCALVAIYWLVGNEKVLINFGNFIAFNAAFGQFFAAILGVTAIFINIIQLIPQYERILPILHTSPEEKVEEEEYLTALSGAVTFKDISFRYQPKQSWVLDHLNLEIHPGEMVAFAGATGCGKSTLLRLLLGFESPNSGLVLYDQHNLAHLNQRVIREQLGIVLQNGVLLPGTIFDNIRGISSISIEAAWDAAEKACIAEDIRNMPMGMHTLVSEWGKTFSMGQRQRLMIAQALVKKPQILILDEATSALDNPTQAKIMAHIEQLSITRIIVAHRLSTLQHAHTIYVLHEGQIAEYGSYEELVAQKGLFTRLIKQQVT